MPQNQVEILLVEDDPENLDLAIGALRDQHLCNGIQVARDGQEALDFLFTRGAHQGRDENSYPKPILLDLNLPKVNALEVLERIRRDPRTQSIPVVILTSSTREQDIAEAYHLGVNSYIQKPADFDQFRTAIQRLGNYWLRINQPPPGMALHRGIRDEIVSPR